MKWYFLSSGCCSLTACLGLCVCFHLAVLQGAGGERGSEGEAAGDGAAAQTEQSGAGETPTGPAGLRLPLTFNFLSVCMFSFTVADGGLIQLVSTVLSLRDSIQIYFYSFKDTVQFKPITIYQNQISPIKTGFTEASL